MATKEIKTRIALRTGDYAYWTTGAGKDIELYKGEVCICTVAQADNQATNAPTVLFKVANANGQKFADLNWVSGLAADVYTWAKENALFIHKEGTGNVVSGVEWDASLNNGKGGVKYTTAAVATAEGLDELQKDIAAIEKDIADNRDAWGKYEDTRYTFSTDGDKLVVKKTLYTNGAAGAEEEVGTYEFLTADEVAKTLEGYYTKDEVDGLIQGVEAKLPTSADYGVLEIKGDDASGVVVDNTDAQRPIVKIAANTYDAHGAAAEVLGNSNDAATANTVYGAKAAAAAAQNDATIAKTKIETFLGTVTPDGSQDIIDTLTEINNYIGEHGEEFATLSGRVTDITKDNGTIDTKIAAYDAGKGFGDIITHNAAEFATNAENGAKALADENKAAIEAINNAETGILAQAKKDAGDKAVVVLGEAQKYADEKVAALAGEGNTTTVKAVADKVEELENAGHLTEVEADTGLKVVPGTKGANNKVAIDETVVFVLDCNW